MITAEIDYKTDYGIVYLKVKDVMDEKGITINTLSKLANIKYETAKKYYYNKNFIYNGEVLAKFCYILNCKIEDILVYEPSETLVK